MNNSGFPVSNGNRSFLWKIARNTVFFFVGLVFFSTIIAVPITYKIMVGTVDKTQCDALASAENK